MTRCGLRRTVGIAGIVYLNDVRKRYGLEARFVEVFLQMGIGCIVAILYLV